MILPDKPPLYVQLFGELCLKNTYPLTNESLLRLTLNQDIMDWAEACSWVGLSLLLETSEALFVVYHQPS